ncbi:MAG: hypothetical protein ACQETH_05330 [Candidatus Rifleibacteriota bacterium]
MDKKTACCGCGCVGLVLIAVAIGVGGYYGFSFLHSAGKDVAAISFNKTMQAVTKDAFNQADRKEILEQTDQVAQKIKTGKIGLIDLFNEGTRQLERGLYSKIILLSFKNHYLLNAENNQDIENANKGAKSVNRLLYGLSSEQISTDQIASITMKITSHFEEKVPAKEGKSDYTFSSRKLNGDLTSEEVQKCVNTIEEICNENNVEIPEDDFTSEAYVKQEIMKIFESLNKSDKEEKQ